MSRFVEECRKEWHRLGVPDAIANEMAADLDADLADAESEGASPEEVLGNAVFDARSFAASWAVARGVVPPDPPASRPVSRVRWALGAVAVFCLALILAGALTSLVGHSQSSVAAIARNARGPIAVPPAIRVGPHMFGPIIVRTETVRVVGLLVLLVGLTGLGAALVLLRPWTLVRQRAKSAGDDGLPSYL